MSVPEIINEYESDDEPIRKLDECDYCPFEEILRGPYAKAGILRADIPKGDHPHRSTIEQVCGKGIDVPCAMKYAMNRMPINDYILAQMETQITFRLDLGKRLKKNIDPNDAGIEWAKDRNSLVGADGNVGSSYAKRWKEVWELSLCSNGRHSLTEIGMYRIIFSDNDKYLGWVKQFKSLTPEEKERHISGIALED